jgi:hypothetical protein
VSSAPRTTHHAPRSNLVVNLGMQADITLLMGHLEDRVRHFAVQSSDTGQQLAGRVSDRITALIATYNVQRTTYNVQRTWCRIRCGSVETDPRFHILYSSLINTVLYCITVVGHRNFEALQSDRGLKAQKTCYHTVP